MIPFEKRVPPSRQIPFPLESSVGDPCVTITSYKVGEYSVVAQEPGRLTAPGWCELTIYGPDAAHWDGLTLSEVNFLAFQVGLELLRGKTAEDALEYARLLMMFK